MTASNKLAAIISPSLLSCDLANIARDSQQMIKFGADWLHLDVMDGHFVPNISFGPPVIASIRKAHKTAFLDVHMMVSDPMKWVKPMADAGVSSYTFHIESDMPEGGVTELIAAIKSAGMKVGIAVKPKTPASAIFDYVELIDIILVMTVEPGFSGQKFMIDMMPKVKELRNRYPYTNISVDGGLGPSTVDEAAGAGANVIAAASAIFGSNDREGVIKELRQSVENALSADGVYLN